MQSGKKKKGIQKGKIQILLFAEHILVYVENMIESTKMVLEISEFSKSKGYKNNINIICGCT